MALLALDSETVAPPVGAGAVSVIVPVADCPPVTLVGFVPSEPSAGTGADVTVNTEVLVVPL